MLLVSKSKDKTIEFPRLYHGAWDVSQKACNEKWSDSRLIIAATSIKYWQSSGEILAISSDSSNSLQVKLSMIGEGEKWIKNAKYSVIESKLTEYFDKYDPFSRVLCEKGLTTN
jgi:hypothetical protein